MKDTRSLPLPTTSLHIEFPRVSDQHPLSVRSSTLYYSMFNKWSRHLCSLLVSSYALVKRYHSFPYVFLFCLFKLTHLLSSCSTMSHPNLSFKMCFPSTKRFDTPKTYYDMHLHLILNHLDRPHTPHTVPYHARSVYH